MSNYIPVGRTSLVQHGDSNYQIQTEYADRPYPRVTSTILHDGQVLHKVEQKVEQAIETPEEQRQTETHITLQHAEVTSIVTNGQLAPKNLSSVSVSSKSANPSIDETTGPPSPVQQRASWQEQCTSIPGFEHVYPIDNHGSFKTEATEKEFRRQFKNVFKALNDVLSVFPFYPGTKGRRERGVYEVDRNRLYLISTGDDCYFVSVMTTTETVDYEKQLREALLTSSV